MKRLARIALTAIISFSMTVGSTPAMAFAESAAAANAAASASTGSPENGQEASPESDGILVTLDKSASDEVSMLSADAGKDIQESKAVQNLEDAGLNVTGKTEDANGTVILTAKSDEGGSDAEALAAAKKADGVKTAQFNYVYHLIEPGVEPDGDPKDTSAQTLSTDDSLAGKLSLLPINDPYTHNGNPKTEDNQYWAYNAKLPGAWRWTQADHSVTVAVMDSGVNVNHEDLKANVLSDNAYNSHAAVIGDTDHKADVTDNVGHGTHVAGIIAGVANNGTGIAGASYNANILPIKVLNDETKTVTSASIKEAYWYLFSLIDAHAVNNLRVVNISLGGYGDSGMNDPVLRKAISTARTVYNIVTVCSGGNGNRVDTPRTDHIYPADWDECISVTALNADGTNIPYSDYNESKDISAPGASIYSTFGDGYAPQSGTSMASPIVSGVAALLYAANPEAQVMDVCEALYKTADPVIDPVNDRSETSGSHGAVNAVAALDYVTKEQNEKAFSDVSARDWFYEGVSFAARHGIMNGYADTDIFDPNGQLLREQAACVLYNYLGNGEISKATDKVDVDQTDGVYYREAVNWVLAHGIMNGYSDGSNRFGIGEPLTREQVACIFSNMLAKDSDFVSMDTTAFDMAPDNNQVSSWATQGVQWALNKSVISGVLDANGARWIQPGGTCTRGMMASIMMNAVKGGTL